MNETNYRTESVPTPLDHSIVNEENNRIIFLFVYVLQLVDSYQDKQREQSRIREKRHRAGLSEETKQKEREADRVRHQKRRTALHTRDQRSVLLRDDVERVRILLKNTNQSLVCT